MNNFGLVFMIISVCFCFFSVGFSVGRSYQERKQFSEEDIRSMMREEIRMAQNVAVTGK